MVIHGELFDAQTSKHWSATLTVHSGALLELQWDEGRVDYPMDAIEVSSRLGNTPRYFTLPDGRMFETRDNDSVDVALASHSKRELHSWQAFLHKLESRMHYVVISLLVVLVFSWAMFKYGLPAAAEAVAYALPQDIMENATETTLGFLDKSYLKPSKLNSEVKQRLTTKFEAMSQQVEQGFDYRLLFREGGGMIGANAFALPSGTIVMTDELVEIAGNDDEILSVLAHELGHVVHRHSLRQVLQNSVMTLFATYITGDVGSVLVTLPIIFVELGYSREFEREADQFAYNYMQQHHIPLNSFANILEGLEAAHSARREEHDRKQGEGIESSFDIFEYLSTHPATAERAKRFRGAE